MREAGGELVSLPASRIDFDVLKSLRHKRRRPHKYKQAVLQLTCLCYYVCRMLLSNHGLWRRDITPRRFCSVSAETVLAYTACIKIKNNADNGNEYCTIKCNYMLIRMLCALQDGALIAHVYDRLCVRLQF